MGEKQASWNEAQVIEVLAHVFATSDPRVIIGIGDDAALVKADGQQILTTDIAVEGVHFRSDWSSGYEIGKRIAVANIADVLSMNGKCDYLLVAATLTGREDIDWIRDLAQGIQDQAKAAGAVVVGGDLARSATLSIAITAVGHTEKAILRSGAVAGDSIYLSSLTGWSAAGLEILSKSISPSGAAVAKALNEYRAPTLNLSIDFSAATSMSDVSDAVLIQGGQMASASRVRFEFDCDAISKASEFSQLLALADEIGADVLNWILQGGEDHALLATGRELPGICIGRVVEGSGVAVFENGGEIKMAPVSWSHF
ncbi:ThiL Thiamine monophosphate kinase [Candidatus Nanopelagicaceae bacterium]